MLLTLPIVIPLMTAAVSLLFWRRTRIQRRIGLAGTLALLIAGILLLRQVWEEGIQVVQGGGWPAPFGITLAADLLGAIMIVVTGLIGVVIAFYSVFSMDDRQEAFGYYPLVHVLLMGVSGAFLTGDIFNLYVWFEVTLIASFVLMALGGERPQMEGALKYVAINLLSSAIFLAAVGLLYGTTGTHNMADLALKMQKGMHSGHISAISMLFLVTFGVKAAVFPLFFWLPASYPTPPVAVSALFAGLLTKVGVYALIRIFTLIFTADAGTYSLITVIAVFTMVTGVLGAAAQNEFRKILSFHIISQVGYMVWGLGVNTAYALAGAIFFMIHNIVAKTNLFLISGVAHRLLGTFELKASGGLYRSKPALSVFFLISAMALAGLPPMSGFFGKFVLIKEGLRTEHYFSSAAALLTGILTLFSMTKIWAEAFWKQPKETQAPALTDEERKDVRNLQLPIALLAALSVLLGLAAGPVLEVITRAAEQLKDPAQYIEAVMGPLP